MSSGDAPNQQARFILRNPAKCGILHWRICCEARAQVKLRIADGKSAAAAAAEAKTPVQG